MSRKGVWTLLILSIFVLALGAIQVAQSQLVYAKGNTSQEIAISKETDGANRNPIEVRAYDSEGNKIATSVGNTGTKEEMIDQMIEEVMRYDMESVDSSDLDVMYVIGISEGEEEELK